MQEDDDDGRRVVREDRKDNILRKTSFDDLIEQNNDERGYGKAIVDSNSSSKRKVDFVKDPASVIFKEGSHVLPEIVQKSSKPQNKKGQQNSHREEQSQEVPFMYRKNHQNYMGNRRNPADQEESMDRFLFEESNVRRDQSPPIPMALHSAFFSASPEAVIIGTSQGLSKVFMENVRNDPRMIDHEKHKHEPPSKHVCDLELSRINYILKNGSIVYLQFSYFSGGDKLHGRKYYSSSLKEEIEDVKKKAKKDKLLKASYVIRGDFYELGNLRFEPREKFTSITAEVVDDIKTITLETSEGERLTIGELTTKGLDQSNSDWNPTQRKTVTKVVPRTGFSFISAGFNGSL